MEETKAARAINVPSRSNARYPGVRVRRQPVAQSKRYRWGGTHGSNQIWMTRSEYDAKFPVQRKKAEPSVYEKGESSGPKDPVVFGSALMPYEGGLDADVMAGALVIYHSPEPGPFVLPVQGLSISNTRIIEGTSQTFSAPSSPSDYGDFFSSAGSPLASDAEEKALVVADDPVPISMHGVEEVDAEVVSDWVLQGVMGLSKQMGITFDGFEHKAMDLFVSIEKKRLEETQGAVKSLVRSPQASLANSSAWSAE